MEVGSGLDDASHDVDNVVIIDNFDGVGMVGCSVALWTLRLLMPQIMCVMPLMFVTVSLPCLYRIP